MIRQLSNEKEVQKSITDYLSAKRIFHFRNNTGAFKAEHGFYRFGAVGSPDVIAVISGRFIGIECKDRSKQSDAQKEFQKNLEAAGGLYILAHSIDDLIEASI